MAKIAYNEITPRTYIILDGDPYEALSSQISKKDRQKASNQTRLKNLRNGNVIERNFHQSDSVEEADISKKKIKYLYINRGEVWFCDPENPRDRFSLSEEIIGERGKFLKENTIIDAVVFEEEIIDIVMPIKVDLVVTEAPPAVRGNTAQGGTKQITLETGAVINTPMFINEGDVVRINTESGEYVERAEKK